MGQWIPFAVPQRNDEAKELEYTYHVDGQSNLWMITGDKSSEPALLKDIIRIDKAGQHSYPELVRNVSYASRIADDFILDARFTPLIGNYIWAEKTQSWEVNPLLAGIGDHIDVGVLWNGQELAWTTLEGRVYLEHNGELQHLPLPMSLGESPFISRSRDVFVTGFFGYSRFRWNPWIERNPDHDDLENVFGVWTSKRGLIRACSPKVKVLELREGTWSAPMDLSGKDQGLTFACYEDARSDLFMHTSTAIWWLPAAETTPIRLADSARGKGPDGFVEDAGGTIWFACLDKIGQASLCSFDMKTVVFHPLGTDQFRSTHGRFCALDIDQTFYMVGADFKMAYDRKDGILRALESKEAIFPDGSRLNLDRCYAIARFSYLIQSDGIYYLWNRANGQLKILEALDSAIKDSWLMPEQDTFQPSADGFVYFSALAAEESAYGDMASDKIRQGSVLRLDPDGTIIEVLKRNMRQQALDQVFVMPQMFVTDASGRLWSLSLSEIYWTQRLIQFTAPIPVGL